SYTGIATIEVCRKFFDAKRVQSQSAALHNTVEVDKALQSHIQSQSLISPKTPLQTYQNLKLTHLKTTPNKRPLEKEELQQYSQDISIICAFTMTKGKLIKEIGEKLVEELSSVRTINPPIWTPALDKYIDNILN
ncbi:35809_t:CDS:2, partial [Gigaspora margarita]